MTAEEERRKKSRDMRFKKPIALNLNLETIQNELWDIQSECEELRWTDNQEALIDAMNGDEEEAWEFAMMFSDLSAECERMSEDLEEEWIPDCFDRLFVAAGAGKYYGGLAGWDSYEQDYFPIGAGMDEWAENEAKKQLKAMTKDQMIDAMQQCFRVYQSYMALRYRYDCLESSMSILRAQNFEHLQIIKDIEKVYTDLWKDGELYAWSKEVQEFDRLTRLLPQDVWIY